MRLIDTRTGIEVMDRSECFELLASTDVGRIAVVDAGHPVIFPVNYAMDGEQIVFRTAPGTKFESTVRGAPVSFEIDWTDTGTRAAWSVVVTGWARIVETESDLARAEALELAPWSDHDKPYYVAVHAERVSGRRITPLDDPAP
ncbi:MAG: pyridoxamine 5'-phosphate oxidase family protein [Acidimicrobiales bacterium]|jgi:nitroimidazol reductase NimA-like FMN-containing flavoprotein (pyridoxamine 5'-phosphate oxidase superfamily)|nr:pyridoxamine 5'-phosphate oxidase family protein [Acidimicrobiales bacterium]